MTYRFASSLTPWTQVRSLLPYSKSDLARTRQSRWILSTNAHACSSFRFDCLTGLLIILFGIEISLAQGESNGFPAPW